MTTMAEDARAFLDAACPCRLVEREGRVAGAYAVRFVPGGREARGVLAGPDGRLRGVRCPVADGDGHDVIVARLTGGATRHDDAAFSSLMLQALHPLGRDDGLRTAEHRVNSGEALLRFRSGRGAHVDPDAFRAVAWEHQEARRPVLDAFLATLVPGTVAAFRDPVVGLKLDRRLWDALSPVDGEPSSLSRALSRMPHLARTLVKAWARRPKAFDGDGPDDRALRAMLVEDLVGRQDVPRRLLRTVADGAASMSAWTRDEAVAARAKYAQAPVTEDLVVTMARLLGPLPPNWHPRGSASWSAAFDAFPALDQVAGGRLGDADAVRFLDAGDGWPSYVARLRTAAGTDDLWGALRDASDVGTRLADQVVTPAVRLARMASRHDLPPFDDMAARRAGLAIVHSGHSLARQVALSARWHRAAARIERTLDDLPRDRRADPAWGAGLPPHRVGDLELVVLVAAAALRDEGRVGPDLDGVDGLSHCVGGYAADCLAGRSRIVSVRRVAPDGTRVRVSTAEVGTRGRDHGLLQHRGASNRRPPPDAAAAVEAYVGALRDGTLPVDRAAFAPVTPDVVMGDPSVGVGYDWTRPGHWEVARDLWAPYVPRSLRTADAATWAATAMAVVKPPGVTWWTRDRVAAVEFDGPGPVPLP